MLISTILSDYLLQTGLLLSITAEGHTLLAFILVVLLFFSFGISGAEVAFFSLSFKDINYLKTRSEPYYKRIISLLHQPKILLASLLIANSLINIAIILLGNFLLGEFINIQNPWLLFASKVLILATVIMLVAELLPKTFAAQNNLRFAKDMGWLAEGVHLLFNGMAKGFVTFSDRLEKNIGTKSAAASIEELNHAIDLTTESEANEEERNILKGIVKFRNISVKQVMRTRLDVSGLDYESTFAAIKKRIEDLHYSRLPVYSGSLDEVKGMIHTKDVLAHLNKGDDFDWHTLIRPAYFVHEQKPIEDLMREFQLKRVHFAIVADEFGGTSGIITLEDILEEIIGEIKDEFDEEESGNRKEDDLNYIFEGKTMLNDVCKMMGLSSDTFDLVRGESDSLAGLILEVAGEIPFANQVITVGDFDFLVLEVEKNRIRKVKVTIKQGNA